MKTTPVSFIRPSTCSLSNFLDLKKSQSSQVYSLVHPRLIRKVITVYKNLEPSATISIGSMYTVTYKPLQTYPVVLKDVKGHLKLFARHHDDDDAEDEDAHRDVRLVQDLQDLVGPGLESLRAGEPLRVVGAPESQALCVG